MEKFYLAKSNKANPDDVMRVRQLLSKYDINVVEYTGGAYSHKPLESCDYLIVIPDINNVEDNTVTLGKGLHEQISYFYGTKKSSRDNILIIKETGHGDLIFSFFNDLDICDSDDYIDYSIAIMKDNDFQLQSFMDNLFDVKIGITKSSNSNFYLLIGK